MLSTPIGWALRCPENEIISFLLSYKFAEKKSTPTSSWNQRGSLSVCKMFVYKDEKWAYKIFAKILQRNVIVKKHLSTAFFLLQRGVLNSTWCEQRISFEVLWLGYNCKLLYWSVLKQWKGHGMRGFENQIDFCTTLTLWPNWCSLW